jgi:hypothetical protein
VDIDSVADELYALSPQEFTAARNVREKEAKTLGDRQLAAAIRQLGKPSIAAWLTNQLVRQHSEQIEPLLDVGAGLREATATLRGDRLRDLGKQQHQLVYALMQQGRALAHAAGHQVSDDTARGVEDTLHAALADESAADQLRAGRLTGTLQRPGFALSADAGSAGPVPQAPSRSPASTGETSGQKRRAAQVDRAERDEQQARAAMRDASRAQDQARDTADSDEEAARQATGLVDRLRKELERAEVEQSRREQTRRTSQASLEMANQAVRETAARLDEATRRRERLST